MKHMKSLESSIIREVSMKTALLNYFIPIRLAKLKDSILSSVDRKLKGIWNFMHCLWECR